MLLHATAVAIDGRAVLLTGPSGAGKSDLALRLIDRGAVLVSDDQVRLSVADGALFADGPDTISGMIEVRGIGIVAIPHAGPMPVALMIDLDSPPHRMPESRTVDLLGHAVPVTALSAFEPSAAIKVELALRSVGR